MDDLPEVSSESISQIAGLMGSQNKLIKPREQFLVEDTIKTRPVLFQALKEGRLPGSAMIEWDDGHGTLRANICDFLMKKLVIATDPGSGESLKVESQKIPDHSWRILY